MRKHLNYWHPLAAYVYFTICLLDYAVMPILSFFYAKQPWQPVTVAGAGIFHLAFAGFCGVGTWSYHKDKQASINQSANQ